MRLTSYIFFTALLTLLLAPTGAAQRTSTLDGRLDTSYGVDGFAYAPGGPFLVGGDSVHTPEGPMFHTTTSRTTVTGPLGITVSKQMVDGAPDHSFGQGGAARIDFPIDTYAAGLAVQSDGKLVISAYQRDWSSNTGYDYVLFRLLPHGELDPEFGDGGLLIVDLAPEAFEGISNDRPGTVVVQPDGNIVVGGISDRYLTGAVRTTAYSVLIRLTPEGQIDTTFGQGGTSEVAIGSNQINSISTGLYVRVADDGKLLAGATVNVPTGSIRGSYASHALVFRFEPNGMPDTTFSGDGVVDISLALSPTYSTNFNCLTELADGKILVLSSDGLARLTATGTLDTSFGTGGRVAIGTDWYLSDLTVTADNRIVVSGTLLQPLVPTGSRLLGQLRRYWPNGSTDFQFGMGGTTILELPDQNIVLGRVTILYGRYLMVTGARNPGSGTSNVFTARFFATP